MVSVHQGDSARMLLERKGEVSREGVKLYRLGANYVWHPWGERGVRVDAGASECVCVCVCQEEGVG